VLGHRADGEMAFGLADVAEVADASDVDEYRWSCKPELHHGNQRVTASEELGFIAVFTQK